jgi:hypothetical protein
MSLYYFYQFQNHLGRTKIGITDNIETRERQYSNAMGEHIRFKKVYSGPEKDITNLEYEAKGVFYDQRCRIELRTPMEWISENVQYETIDQYIDHEVENRYVKLELVRGVRPPVPTADNVFE